MVVLAGCGTPGAPLPPSLDLPQPVTDLNVTRTGDSVSASFTTPDENTDRLAIKQLGAIVLEQCDDSRGASCSRLNAWPAKSVKPGDRVTWTGPLPVRPYLCVVVNNDRGRSTPPGNAHWIPLPPAALPARILEAKVTRDAIVLTLQPSSSGFLRISRIGEGDRAQTPLPEQPANSTQITDNNFEWQRKYIYSVETINRATAPDGTVVDFASAAPVSVTVVANDVFPPATPTGLSAVFTGTEPGKLSIDLSWNPITERDVAGYNIYRDGSKINREPVKAPYYRDLALKPNTQYRYEVTAVDLRGNESTRSTPATEQVPQQP